VSRRAGTGKVERKLPPGSGGSSVDNATSHSRAAQASFRFSGRFGRGPSRGTISGPGRCAFRQHHVCGNDTAFTRVVVNLPGTGIRNLDPSTISGGSGRTATRCERRSESAIRRRRIRAMLNETYLLFARESLVEA
jgi:hypothetical protein